MSLLCQKLTTGGDIYRLTQEPWFYGIQTRGTPFSAGPSIVPRCCIFIRNTVHASLLSDETTEKMTYTRGRSKRELNLTSAYLPYNSFEPTKWLREAILYCCRNKLCFISGCDTSEHYIIRGSMDINH
jgi:hypothetical protein